LADKVGQSADDKAFQEYRAMAKQMHRWRVVKMKAKGEEVCTIEAPDAETAIALAVERYQITDPETRKRLAAVRLG
jgi:Ni,Fe-hydrogenase III large subunit